MNLKGEMSMLNVLHLENSDVDAIIKQLRRKRDEMPQFFMQSPIVIDCSLLAEDADEFDFSEFKEALLKLNFIPVGVRNAPVEMNTSLRKAGWAIMRESRKPANEVQQDNIEQQANESSVMVDEIEEIDPNMDLPLGKIEMPEQSIEVDERTLSTGSSSETAQIAAQHHHDYAQAPVETTKSLTVDKPVRSGQQVYAAESNMTVLAPTSAGSEIMADGSIHVYGPLRGRVLAGALGNESARIFCQSLQAELIAIAGRYQLLDEIDTNLIGKPAMIKLENEKLVIEPLFA